MKVSKLVIAVFSSALAVSAFSLGDNSIGKRKPALRHGFTGGAKLKVTTSNGSTIERNSVGHHSTRR